MPTVSTGAQLWRVAALYDDELRRLGGVRAASWCGVVIAAVSLVRLLTKTPTVFVIVDALSWLSWVVAGLITFSVARRWQDFQRPVRSLAEERGVASSAQTLAAPLALGWRLLIAVGTPALSLTLLALALSNNWDHVLMRSMLLLMTAFYALLLAVGLAVLLQAIERIGRTALPSWLVAIVIAPQLLRELWPNTPSFINAYAWLLTQVTRLGGAA